MREPRPGVWPIALLLGAMALAGCGESSPGAVHPVELSWSFVDGRTCTEAGVPVVAVLPPGAARPATLDCHAGLDHPVAVGDLPAGALMVEGLSVDETPLYRGFVTVPAAPARLAVVLVFVGGAPPP